MAEKRETAQFPTEVIDLPSGGKCYSKSSSLSSGKIEIKYMTAKEEDILTSENLIKKGVVIEKLLKSLIITKDVEPDDLIIGDKNAVMIACRILAYGPKYTVELENRYTGEKFNHEFDLTDCPFKVLPKDIDYSAEDFSMTLPASKINIKFKLLTGKDETMIIEEIKRASKFGTPADMTTRLRHIIVEVDGNREVAQINKFVNNMLSRDSLALRQEVLRISPDIQLTQEVEMEGEMVEVDIPLTTNFFWPSAV